MAQRIDQHTAIQKLLQLAQELGRTPDWKEVQQAVSNNVIYKLFGSLDAYIEAAGLEPAKRNNSKKIDNSIFTAEIESVLEAYQPRDEISPFIIKKLDVKFACISDFHFPWVNKKVLDVFYSFIKEHQPDIVIINGDAWDMYSHMKYTRSMNGYSPREEQALARKMNEDFWKTVQSLCKKVQCIQMLGNHDIRPLKKTLEHYPEAEDWIKEKLKELFTFDGVTTIHDYRQELMINDDLIFHGYRTKLGDHRDYTHMNCHNGHQHVGGTVYRRIKGKTLFECNSGVAGDIESKALSYTPQKMTHQTPGFSYRDKWGPRFIAV